MAISESFCRRRRKSQTLAPLIIPSQNVEFPADYDDVVEEGTSLFNEFIAKRFEEENVEESSQLTPEVILNDHKNPMWARAGRELRFMADEFARSSRRNEVKLEAQQVNIINITYEQFKELLSALFCEGRITKERIMVLFFFCSDVAIRCLTEGPQICQRFLAWSTSFITQIVCRWVRDCGGWDDVLVMNRIPSIPAPVVALGIVCIATYFAVKYYKS